jgi:hypothetical protein
MALKRFRTGPGGVFKRAPGNRPDWLRVRRSFVRADGRRSPTTRQGSPGSSTSAASTSTPTRSDPTTSITPTSCGSTWTRYLASSGPRSATWRWSRRRRSRRLGSPAGRRRRAPAGSTSTSGSSAAGRIRRSVARPWPSPATSNDERPRSRHRSGGRKSATASSSTLNAKDRPSHRPLRPPLRTPASRRPCLGRVPDVQAERFTIATVRSGSPRSATPARNRRRRGSSTRSRLCRDEAEGWATRRGRPTTGSRRASRPGQPSRQRAQPKR